MEKKLIYTCAYPSCANIFTAKPSQKRLYCCKECFYDDRAIPIRPLPMEELERTQIEATILRFKSLVISVARNLCLEYNPRNMDLDDFIQVGMLGLIQAIQDDTDTTLERFPGFAKFHIRMAIIFAYRTQEHTIRLPESLFRHDAKVSPAQLEAYKEFACPASLARLNPVTQHFSEHDAPALTEATVLKADLIDELYQSLRKLPSQQRQMIAEHYGLTCDATAMLQLCYKYKIARATMHRLVHRGLDILKSTLVDTAS